ncbi:transcriptional modulator of MazE/toxin, MazF [Methanolobus psychrophilus R15]|nr:transcriptional modulator of MazE/toxin, MazF [Methanolobus psychrophilus R15]
MNQNDLNRGTLKIDSLIRTNKIFTATGDIIEYELGKITEAKLKEVEDKLVEIILKR